MSKDHIAIRCPHCGRRMQIGWPTAHAPQLRTKCPACEASFPLAEAVERTVIGTADDRDLHFARNSSERSGRPVLSFGPQAARGDNDEQ